MIHSRIKLSSYFFISFILCFYFFYSNSVPRELLLRMFWSLVSWLFVSLIFWYFVVACLAACRLDQFISWTIHFAKFSITSFHLENGAFALMQKTDFYWWDWKWHSNEIEEERGWRSLHSCDGEMIEKSMMRIVRTCANVFDRREVRRHLNR